jgi:hypothetical protein
MKPRVSYSPLRGTFSIRVGDHDAERITIGAVGAFSSVNRGGSATLPGRSRPSNSELGLGASRPLHPVAAHGAKESAALRFHLFHDPRSLEEVSNPSWLEPFCIREQPTI